MVTTYNEKDIKSFGKYVKEAIEADGVEKFNIDRIFKSWLYHSDKARFEVKDLVSFGNELSKRIKEGDKKPDPSGEYLVSDSDMANWLYKEH